MNNQTMNNQTMKRRMFHGLRFAAFGIVAVIVMGLVTSGLWNVPATSIFGFRAITFWEALGLMLLSRILLGGRHGFGRGGRLRHGKFVSRWDHLNAEEKAHFRKAMGKAPLLKIASAECFGVRSASRARPGQAEPPILRGGMRVWLRKT
jgi:hypothetical protein